MELYRLTTLKRLAVDRLKNPLGSFFCSTVAEVVSAADYCSDILDWSRFANNQKVGVARFCPVTFGHLSLDCVSQVTEQELHHHAPLLTFSLS